MPKILIVDDEPGIRFGVRDFLEREGLDVEEADTCAAAEKAVREFHPDAMVLDHMLPDGTALELLPKIREIDSTLPVVVLTGHATIDLAVRAVKEGADQFLAKPVELPALLVMLRRLLESQREKRRQAAGRARQAREAVDPFTGTSAAIRRLAEDARKVAASSSPILIEGDTGSGKGVLARWLHRNGPRADEAFVDMNCAGPVARVPGDGALRPREGRLHRRRQLASRACSRWPTAASCSSTRSATSTRRSSPSC